MEPRVIAAVFLAACFSGASAAPGRSVKDLIGDSPTVEAEIRRKGLRIPEAVRPVMARQYLPPDNDNPGFDWSTADQGTLTTEGGAKPALPGNIAAFLDVIAYAEGTRDSYNIMFTFARFRSYADHPRKTNCIPGLCSTAAGRYQFLSKTWDPLAKALGLKDFTPSSQDKAVMEIIRRAGAYEAVSGSSDYASFVSAVRRLNRTWASLPGAPYKQPRRKMDALWKKFQQARKAYP